MALRSKIALRCAIGFDNCGVTDAASVSQTTVGEWRRRIAEHLLDSLLDPAAPRRRRLAVAGTRVAGAIQSLTSSMIPLVNATWPNRPFRSSANPCAEKLSPMSVMVSRTELLERRGADGGATGSCNTPETARAPDLHSCRRRIWKPTKSLRPREPMWVQVWTSKSCAAEDSGVSGCRASRPRRSTAPSRVDSPRDRWRATARTPRGWFPAPRCAGYVGSCRPCR